MPYEIITAHGKLTDEHREELTKKRGFTPETISRNRFFSGGSYLLELEARLLKEFETDKLIQMGLFYIVDGKPTMTQRLLENRIIIPYLNKEGKSCLIRPHKLGLKEVGVNIYHELNVASPDKKAIILTEGEFKAAASQQLGIPSIGVPGVGSFSKTHFTRLVTFLNDNNVKEIVIIFDNEKKDDPQFDNYKDNPAKRWDSQFYAFFMSKLLTKEGFKANVAWLPDGWRTGGKIDIDGAVAMGKTKEDFLQLIHASKSSKHFFEDLPEEAQKIIKRKMAQKYFRSHIRNEFGKYVATRWRGRTEIDEEISNFTLKILATHETLEGIVREIQFLDETGDGGHCFALKADEMGADAFATFCLAKGNYIWKGKKEDLQILWQENFLNDDGRHIIEPDHIGYLEKEKMWMFSNVVITDKGEEMRPDENGIFWTEKRGYKPVSLGITSGKQAISEGMPYLSINDQVNIEEIKKNLSDTIGDVEATKALAWITAVVFMENAFKKYGCFPFLFVTGKTGSGKSTIADWICSFFGIEHNGITLSQTTAGAIQRSLGYYSSIPVFLDEYRNTSDIIYKTHFLRNVYNRQSSGKGVKANFGLRMAKVRGTVVIAGEELPNDAALINRSIIIEIIKAKKREDHYEWFCREKSKFSRFFYDILKNKKALDEKFDSMMAKGKIAFMASKIDERTAINYAILCAGYACSFGESKEFAQLIVADIKRVQVDNKQASMISQFIQDISAMKFNGQIDGRYWEIKSDGELHIYFQGLYNLWAKDCRQRGVNILKAESLQGYFKEEAGFIKNRHMSKIDNKSVRCSVFKLNEASPELQELVDE
jgi:DNA primase